MSIDSLIYDWNRDGRAAKADYRSVELDDETLRDGLQGPSVRNPPTEIKKRLLHLMDQLGIDSADIGLPGASERARTEIVALAKETTTLKRLRPNMALRTHPADVKGGIEAAQQSGVAIEACAFIGSSPIRRFAEDWSIDTMLRNVEESVTALDKAGLPVMFVTEDTTRADAETLSRLYETAIGCGAKRICASDTVGHATPEGVRNLLTFLRKDVIRGRDVKLDYHGHNDRGFGTINALAATAIADRVHGCALGIGERVGNTSMDQLLINMQLWGLIDRDLSPLAEYVSLVSQHCGVPVPANYPALGEDAFRTGTGVHAAAVIKALRKGDRALADSVYSGVPASVLGREQRIEVGPMSGESNVVYWLESHGFEASQERVARIFEHAKQSDRLLTPQELDALARG
ncbi:MAG: 2-isopropylmalate synthase [Chloroflexi bacterium]|nr:MAG: 2-isopropylmalate synthase [Chloroflexota bacterium]TMC27671.1 MAG: 2-isopropylmalate synthase [Chloroflexota bacterium]TMC53261.1 MAG: 2-isopropylmalate synthase [Chloroflexota bacterium]